LSRADRLAADVARLGETLAHLEQRGDAGTLVYANALRNLGYAYMDAGQLEQARDYYQRALDTAQATDPEHWIVPSALGFLALIARYEGDFDRARALSEESLRHDEEHDGPESLAVATALNHLMIVAGWQGRSDEALAYGRRAVEIVNRIKGPLDLDTALFQNNLGHHLRACGRYEEARQLFSSSVVAYEQLAPDSDWELMARQQLAGLLVEQGSLERARVQAERCTRIFERRGIDDSYEVSVNLGILAEIAKAEGRLDEAGELAERSHAMRVRRLGPQASDTAWAALRLAKIRIAQERMADAAELIDSVLRNETPHVAQGRVAPKARLYMAHVDLLDGAPESALEWLDPDPSGSYAYLAQVHATRGRALAELYELPEAYEAFARALTVTAEGLATELASMSEGERFRFFALQSDPSGLLDCVANMSDPPLEEALEGEAHPHPALLRGGAEPLAGRRDHVAGRRRPAAGQGHLRPVGRGGRGESSR
jgi:tetratricopeptide (TPR) repeat protein